MQACLILLTLAVSPSTTQCPSPLIVPVPTEDLVFLQEATFTQKLDAISEWLNVWKDSSEYNMIYLVNHTFKWNTLIETVQGLQNANSQLLLQCNSAAPDSSSAAPDSSSATPDCSELLSDLEVLKSRQAVAGTIQAVQVFLFLAYLATIAVCYLVKRCRKHQKEAAKAEFELLETKLQASRSRRRAAAAARSNKQTPQ